MKKMKKKKGNHLKNYFSTNLQVEKEKETGENNWQILNKKK